LLACDISFDMIKNKIDCNCNFDALCKPKHLIFLIFKFIDPYGSHFLAYFNKLNDQ